MLQANPLAVAIGKKVAARLITEGKPDLAPVSSGLVEKELSAERGSLTAFSQIMYKRYLRAAHLDLLDSYLMRVTQYVESIGAEGIGGLIIAMPPRHGKSMKVSKLYPTWHLARNPLHRVMIVSYGQGLANKNSRFARNLIRSKQYQSLFPDTQLARDSRNVTAWDIAGADGEGGMDALGIGGGATGSGAHVLIIDDPIKNRKQAESLTYRNAIWDSYTDDLLTRLAPGGAVIVMATRWHEDDLTGRLLKNERDKWTVLNLPALAVDEDVLGREVGAALWPERFPRAALEERRDKMGPYGWTSLYQQDPKPSEGGILKAKWFETRTIPELVREVRYWDLAMSEKTSADFTVGVRIGLGEDGHHYITDVARAQKELADLPQFMIDVMLKDGPAVHQGFENKGYMTRAVQTVAKDTRLAKVVIKGYDVDTDKMTRVLPFAARAALSLIHLADKTWVKAYIDEMKAFPNGAHDDQVDASSGAWGMINEEPRKPRVATTSSWIGS